MKRGGGATAPILYLPSRTSPMNVRLATLLAAAMSCGLATTAVFAQDTMAASSSTAMSHDAMKADSMKHDAMKPDAMKHDSMKMDGMKHGAMKHDAMKKGTMKKDAMKKDAMSSGG
jgi:pentapeptide MXKDX repeat protein